MGTRKRVGLILPSTNTVLEPDFYLLAPQGVTIHTSRMWLTEVTLEGLHRMNAEVEACARYLTTAGVDIIVYGCTSGSFYGGLAHDRKVLDEIARATGLPAVATTTAAVEAMRLLGMRRLSVASPYLDEVNQRLKAFLEESGFEVLNVAGQQLRGAHDIGEQLPETVLEFSRKACLPEAEGVFLSCTDWRALEVVGKLERELGRPVVTANQATIWAALRALGALTPMMGYGRLLEDAQLAKGAE